MEGYSVTEAASVLGVPTERVWELLARGVLSGASDGESGMRVFLQPRPPPQLVDEPRGSNGHGSARGTDAEASPFRELLTEFRGLTERYGQALLALGEARGEVASLRSRVDVLEARMDLRLPFSSPMTSEPARRASDRRRPGPAEAEHDTMFEREAAVEAEADEEPAPRRKRSRAHFSDEFADALARAEDPSPAVLPDAPESEKAVADDHERDEAPAEAESAEWALPRELPAAEAIAVAETEPEPEPGPAWAHDPERRLEVELQPGAELAPPTAEPALDHEPQPVGEPRAEALPREEPELYADPEPEPVLEAEPEPAPEPEPEPVLEAEPEPVPEPVLQAEPEPVLEAEPEPVPEPVLQAEPEPALEAEPEPEPVPVLQGEPEPSLDAEPEPEPVLEAEPEPEPEPLPVAADEPVLVADVVEPEPVAGAEPAADLSAEPPSEVQAVPAEQPGFEPPSADEAAPDMEPEPHGEPSDRLAFEEEPPMDAVAAGEGEQSPKPSWDQETYSARIEEPDWWTPEESLWPEPDASSVPASPAAPAEAPQPIAFDDDGWAGHDSASGWPAPESDESAAEDQPEAPADAVMEDDAVDPREDTAAASVQVDSQVERTQPYIGEETMLWFGRRPEVSGSTESPPEDAAGEMEVASTGHRSRFTPEPGAGLPGGEELDDALAGLDSLVGQRGPNVVDPAVTPRLEAEPGQSGMSPRVGAQPAPRPPQLSAPSGPATRAYRRLRRIFPG